MRKLAIALCGALLMLAAFISIPSLRAFAANTACMMDQGGSTFTIGAACTMSGAGALIVTGRVGIPNGAAPAATCTVGELFLDTAEGTDTNCTTTADNSLCLCVATDTWVTLENN